MKKILLFAFALLSASFCFADAFSRVLEKPVGISWEGAPVRDAFNRIHDQTGVPIWVDRRVVPDAKITGSFQNATLPQILREAVYSDFLKDQDLELTQTGSLLYVGPKSFAQMIRTLCELKREELKANLKSPEQKKWLADHALKWERLAEPKAILKDLAEEENLTVKGLKSVPHDLWPEKSFPVVCPLDAFLLILGQFDLTLSFTKDGAEIVPLDPEEIVLTKVYSAKKASGKKLAAVKEAFPGTKIKQKSEKVQVRGLAEVHEFLASDSGAAGQISVGGFTLAQLGGGTASGRTPEGVDRSLEVYSLKFALPFWPAMKQLCKQQNLELEADTDELVAAGIDLAQVVSVEVKNASLERIFQEIANAAGCEARLVGNKVIVKAKK
ncbi:MAG: hypothetical protein IJQ31_15350 [Thermoguttaceae bacterium]|nr:hypothetical protein [Thermoguttaceae bacterium]